MRTFILLIIIFSLYLIYRLAFPKQSGKETCGNTVRRNEQKTYGEGVEKKRYVLPKKGQTEPIAAMTLKTENQHEKAITFAAGNKKSSAIISAEMPEDVSDSEIDPNDLDIEPDDEDETDEPVDAEEESEELRQALGQGAELAGGLSIEEMAEAFNAINHPTDEKAGLLYKVETTDMFEQLVSGDEGCRQRIAAIIDRYIQRQNLEVKSEECDDEEWQAFDVAKYVSKTV